MQLGGAKKSRNVYKLCSSLWRPRNKLHQCDCWTPAGWMAATGQGGIHGAKPQKCCSWQPQVFVYVSVYVMATSLCVPAGGNRNWSFTLLLCHEDCCEPLVKCRKKTLTSCIPTKPVATSDGPVCVCVVHCAVQFLIAF